MRVVSSALLLLGAASSSLAFIVPARLASAPLASRRSVLSMSTTQESTNVRNPSHPLTGTLPTPHHARALQFLPRPLVADRALCCCVSQLKDIVDTAVGAGSFKTLATALTVAGLVDTLKSSGPFTVFAPTDEAFAKIPKVRSTPLPFSSLSLPAPLGLPLHAAYTCLFFLCLSVLAHPGRHPVGQGQAHVHPHLPRRARHH